jgi:hypothetical protein
MLQFETEVLDDLDINVEDGGSAKIAVLTPNNIEDPDNGIFIRFHSWRENDTDHSEFDTLIQPGKRYKVTIEEIK